MIRLLAPDADFPARLTQPEFCAVPTDTPINPKGERAIPSAGPYYLASYTPGQGVVLERQPELPREPSTLVCTDRGYDGSLLAASRGRRHGRHR